MNLKFLSFFVLLVTFLSLSYVIADTDGVWHDVEDIRGGTFGADEQDTLSSGYTFINPTTFQDELRLDPDNDENALFVIDSGISSAFYSAIEFHSQGVGLWSLGKDAFNNFYIDEDGVANRFTILSGSGNIGIGTSSPSSALEVVGIITGNGSGLSSVDAFSLGGILASAYQQQITAGCTGPNQYIKSIASDGSITCGSHPEVMGSCSGGAFIESINADGSITCSQPSTQIVGSCPEGQYVTGVTLSGVICEDPTGGVQPDPIDCVGEYGPWYGCTAPPGGSGTEYADLISITTQAQNGGATCPLTITQACTAPAQGTWACQAVGGEGAGSYAACSSSPPSGICNVGATCTYGEGVGFPEPLVIEFDCTCI